MFDERLYKSLETSKYGYNIYEMTIMALITAFTNLNGIPTVMIFIRNK